MASFRRGFRMGIGLSGLGYGLYRLLQGERNWTTASLLTTGLSMTVSAVADEPHRGMAGQMGQLATAVTVPLRRWNRPFMTISPRMLDTARAAAMNLIH